MPVTFTCVKCGEVACGGGSSPSRSLCKKCYDKEYKLKNNELAWKRWLKTMYNISFVEYQNLLELQNNSCAICGNESDRESGRFDIDHDHSCCPGKKSCGSCVRGLLCNKCNRGIAFLNDNPEILRRAANYLERSV